MEFAFTEEQEMFRKAAREFAETMVARHVEQMESNETARLGMVAAAALDVHLTGAELVVDLEAIGGEFVDITLQKIDAFIVENCEVIRPRLCSNAVIERHLSQVFVGK